MGYRRDTRLGFEQLEDRRMLAMFVVDSVADSGPGSLRDAIQQANALQGPDEIVFAPELSGQTIVLDGSRLDVQDSVVIDATALPDGLTIDGNYQSQLMQIVTQHSELRGLTFTGGGGGQAGTIVCNGVLVVDSCTFVNNDRVAIDNSGALTVSRSFFHHNTGFGAAALRNSGRATIVDSTFAENGRRPTPQFDPPPVIYSYGSNSTLTIERSTIGGNEKASGWIGQGDLIGQGTSIYASSFFNVDALIKNSIVFGAVTGDVVAEYSLLADVDPEFVDGVGNVLNANPQIGPLAYNGGPTLTYALMPGSPALDAGDPDFVADANATDQRGDPYQRVVGRLDIGAYESQATPTATPGDFNEDGRVDAADYTVWRNSLGTNVGAFGPGDATGDGLVDANDYATWRDHYGHVPLGGDDLVVNSLADDDDGDIFNGRTTLREAINFSRTAHWADTITFDPSLSGEVIEVGTSELYNPPYSYYQIETALTIDARMLPEGITLNAGGRTVGLHINAYFVSTSNDFDVTLAGLTISGGVGLFGGGGAINSLTTGKLTLVDCNLIDSDAGGVGNLGGAIFANGDVELIDTTIDGATNLYSGDSAIYAEGNVTLVRSTIRNVGDTSRRSYGIRAGSLEYGQATVTVVDSVIENATKGGVYVYGDIVIEGSRIDNNQGHGVVARIAGNFTSAPGGNVRLVDSSVSNNTRNFSVSLSENTGSGIYAERDIAIVRSRVDNNRLVDAYNQKGGGVYANGRVLAIDSSISGNNAAVGGGIYAIGRYYVGWLPDDEESVVHLIGTAVNDNEGGAAIDSRGSILIETSSVSGNELAGGSSGGGPNGTVVISTSGVNRRIAISDSVLAGNSGTVEFGACVVNAYPGVIIEIIRTDVIDNELNGVAATRLVDSVIARNAGTGVLGNGAGLVEIQRSTIIGNRSGGVNAAYVHIEDSTIRGNTAYYDNTFSYGNAAGVRANSALIERSLIADNHATFPHATYASNASGGISASSLALIESTVRDNSVAGVGALGGGVNSYYRLYIYGSTISGNVAVGEGARGGGVYATGSSLFRQSTFSGNRVEGAGAQGGGIWATSLDAMHLTVVDSAASGVAAEGGGVYTETVSTLVGSVLAGNTATFSAPDLRATTVDPSDTLPGVAYSLVQNSAGSPLADGGGRIGNLIGVNPLLGPLADNGGLTYTHAPLPGSPLIDAGDPTLTSVPLAFSFPIPPPISIPGIYDQRGEPFDRVVDGGSGVVRIDIGAVEVQSPAAAATMFGAGGLAALPSDSNSAVPTPAEVAVDEALATATADDLLLIVRLKSLVAGEMASFDNLGSPFEVGESDGDESLAALIGVAGLSAVDDDPPTE